MDYNGILSDLTMQLVNNGREYIEITRSSQIHPIIKDRILQQKNKMIFSLLDLIKNTTHKIKLIKNKLVDLEDKRKVNDKINEKISSIDNILLEAKNEVNKGTNLNILTSEINNKPLISHSINIKSLINFTLRVSSNLEAPKGYYNLDQLPHHFNLPFPDDYVMKKSILYMGGKNKYKIDKPRLKKPNIKPDTSLVTKGTLLELSYPEANKKGVFFKYTIGEDRIPTFFNGEKYDANNKLEIVDNLVIKVCSCKEGFMDSSIVEMRYTVTSDFLNNNLKNDMIYINEGNDNANAERPSLHLPNEAYKPLSMSDLGDDSSSIITSNPGSFYQMSFHRKESFNKENNEDDEF